jgi:peptidoglycan hydrolase CwlO-like protein
LRNSNDLDTQYAVVSRELPATRVYTSSAIEATDTSLTRQTLHWQRRYNKLEQQHARLQQDFQALAEQLSQAQNTCDDKESTIKHMHATLAKLK